MTSVEELVGACNKLFKFINFMIDQKVSHKMEQLSVTQNGTVNCFCTKCDFNEKTFHVLLVWRSLSEKYVPFLFVVMT